MYKVLICVLAGLGAGLGTGFAGMSAAVPLSCLSCGKLRTHFFPGVHQVYYISGGNGFASR